MDNAFQKKIINLEIPTGTPLLIRFEKNLQVKAYKYMDKKRSKKKAGRYQLKAVKSKILSTKVRNVLI